MKKKRRLKKPLKIIIGIILLCTVVIVSYFIGISKVNNKDEPIEFIVEKGNTFSSISKALKEKKLIRSEICYKIYLKLHHIDGLQSGSYELKQNMNVKELVKELENHTIYNQNVTKITFKEGINMRQIVKLISENTENTEEQIYEILKNQEYLQELINKYWFLEDDIKNEKIYYSLEGYLFPDTYEFHVDSDIKTIFKAMLDNMEKKLEPYKKKIQNNSYSIHQIMTLASIVELEAAGSDDRAGVAGVFYNRLKSGMSLGSDVTTYYAIKVDMSERDLYQSELDDYNAYNTRSSKMAGKLPIGPICIPGLDAIKAAIEPTDHNYLYFVADKNKKTYFSKSSSEHVNTVARLKKENLWYQY